MKPKWNHLRHQPRKSLGAFLPRVLFWVLLLILTTIYLVFSLFSGGNTNSDLTDIVRKSEERVGLTNNSRWVELISWEPRAVVYHNFLTNEECEHLIQLAKPTMVKSEMVGEKSCGVRKTSKEIFLRRQDEVVERIEKRISDYTLIPVENGEGLQVLLDQVGHKSEPHYDYFFDEFNTKNGGQRIATVLMHLSDVDEGGETVFPVAKGNISAVSWWNELSKCGKEKLSVLPKKRNALLFWNTRHDASLDPSSLRGGCPVVKGTNGHPQNGSMSTSSRFRRNKTKQS